MSDNLFADAGRNGWFDNKLTCLSPASSSNSYPRMWCVSRILVCPRFPRESDATSHSDQPCFPVTSLVHSCKPFLTSLTCSRHCKVAMLHSTHVFAYGAPKCQPTAMGWKRHGAASIHVVRPVMSALCCDQDLLSCIYRDQTQQIHQIFPAPLEYCPT